MHLGKAHLAPYDLMSWGAVCTCSARASVLHLLTFSRPTGQAVVTTDAKLGIYMYTTPTCVLLWLPFLCGAGCTRQRRKTFLAWGPPILGNFELGTLNSVHGCTLARPAWRRMT